jgi:hypothetical protein
MRLGLNKQDIALLFTEWLESKSYHEAARAVEGDVLGVKRVKNEVSVEVERALLGMSLVLPPIWSFSSQRPSPSV